MMIYFVFNLFVFLSFFLSFFLVLNFFPLSYFFFKRKITNVLYLNCFCVFSSFVDCIKSDLTCHVDCIKSDLTCHQDCRKTNTTGATSRTELNVTSVHLMSHRFFLVGLGNSVFSFMSTVL